MRDNPRGDWSASAGCTPRAAGAGSTCVRSTRRRTEIAARPTGMGEPPGPGDRSRMAAVARRGGRIDRSRPRPFTFDGREYEGFEGDTLASALLANGVDVVCRSPILGRPRGVVSAGRGGAERVRGGRRSRGSSRSSPRPTVNLVDGLVASGRPGVGRLPADGRVAPGPMYRHVHVETLVVGGGGAGLEAARRAAAERGERVLLVEREPYLAGSRRSTAGPRAGVELASLTRATALGVYDDGYVVVLHERSAHERRVARPRRPRRAGDRRARTADRVRRQRPAGRDARRGGRLLRPTTSACSRERGRGVHHEP